MTSIVHEDGKKYRNSHQRRYGSRVPSRQVPVPAKNQSLSTSVDTEDPTIKYQAFPLLRDMLLHEKARRRNLEQNGRKQILYAKSTDGWLKTLFVLEGRALDTFIYPWLFVSLHAVAWTLFSELYLAKRYIIQLDSLESIVGIMLSSALSFLLVFRLNRSAERFWRARLAWGIIIASSRSLVGGVLTHSSHDCRHRDEVIRWVAAFSVTLTHFMRKVPQNHGTLLGILTEEETRYLGTLAHPPLYVAERIRKNLAKAFYFDENTPLAAAHGRSQRLSHLEKEIDSLILQMGALERIQATPLPLVYVTHLRTFLIFFLLGIPYAWQATLGYGTIPLVVTMAYAMLGLEGAAIECEAPFEKGRSNHLSMDAFSMVVIRDVTELIKCRADMEMGATRNQEVEDI